MLISHLNFIKFKQIIISFLHSHPYNIASKFNIIIQLNVLILKMHITTLIINNIQKCPIILIKCPKVKRQDNEHNDKNDKICYKIVILQLININQTRLILVYLKSNILNHHKIPQLIAQALYSYLLLFFQQPQYFCLIIQNMLSIFF